MYRKISQEYTDDFWQKYIDNNKENKLKVVLHYAYTPQEVSHLKILVYTDFFVFVGLIYMSYLFGRYW